MLIYLAKSDALLEITAMGFTAMLWFYRSTTFLFLKKPEHHQSKNSWTRNEIVTWTCPPTNGLVNCTCNLQEAVHTHYGKHRPVPTVNLAGALWYKNARASSEFENQCISNIKALHRKPKDPNWQNTRIRNQTSHKAYKAIPLTNLVGNHFRSPWDKVIRL